MTVPVRNGRFDVVIAAGPNIEAWPTIGVKIFTQLCAEMGLSVGVFGGEDLRVRGALPLPGTGAIVMVEDVQRRIHRIETRALVKVVARSPWPDPFSGWYSQGLIPISTAVRLLRESQVTWEPAVAILGTGNRALRFGSELLEASGASEVFCIETDPRWGAKRFAGWEVERRRFETAGGRLIEAVPVRLSSKSAQRWELRIQDGQGIRLLEVARVVSAGPFGPSEEIREHPAGSLLFELDQTALATPEANAGGYAAEEERARFLAAKVVRSLVPELGDRREELDRIYRRSRARLRAFGTHFEEPFTPAYQGKWISSADMKRIKSFSGVPQKAHQSRQVASIECFETISCTLCQQKCPENAISFSRGGKESEGSILREDACTACGICLQVCPSGAPVLLEEKEDRPLSSLTVPYRGAKTLAPGEFATILNRRGESLGTARVATVADPVGGVRLVQIEVPNHLLWEVRGIRKLQGKSTEEENFLASVQRPHPTAEKVEITLDGEKRLVRDGIPISLALFEAGRNRAEDAPLCRDGSCGLCVVSVDGIRKLGCQTTTHRGMAIKLESLGARNPDALCPCLGVKAEDVVERIAQAHLQSSEAALPATHVGEGKCHGQLCSSSFRRLFREMGNDEVRSDQWIDWRFPWSEWVMSRN